MPSPPPENDPPQDDGADAIRWTESGAPRSARFDDVFFSDADGLAESEHVFLGGVDLSARLAEAEAGQPLRIGEIGFGMGLNLLAGWSALTRSGAEARIEYAGFERAPPTADEIRRALAPWPRLAPLRERLLAEWPPAAESVAIDARLQLTLYVGEALERIGDLAEPRDVWWLDGFSPAKNPDAWAPELLAAIFERTRPGGALATYAAAGWVRRGLQAAGFDVRRAPGFGAKREMLTARRP